MGNALLFTACLLGATVLGGFIGSCCSKGRQAGDHEGRIAEMEERLDALATHCMEEDQAIRERVAECELLIGDPPTEGLLGRVSALESAQKTHEQDAVIVNGWVEEIKALKKDMEGLQMVNEEEHRVLRDVILALNKHGHGCVVGLEAELGRKKEAQDGC